MADLSQIRVHGNTYGIKDRIAREQIDSLYGAFLTDKQSGEILSTELAAEGTHIKDLNVHITATGSGKLTVQNYGKNLFDFSQPQVTLTELSGSPKGYRIYLPEGYYYLSHKSSNTFRTVTIKIMNGGQFKKLGDYIQGTTGKKIYNSTYFYWGDGSTVGGTNKKNDNAIKVKIEKGDVLYFSDISEYCTDIQIMCGKDVDFDINNPLPVTPMQNYIAPTNYEIEYNGSGNYPVNIPVNFGANTIVPMMPLPENVGSVVFDGTFTLDPNLILESASFRNGQLTLLDTIDSNISLDISDFGTANIKTNSVPTEDAHVTTKSYVDNELNSKTFRVETLKGKEIYIKNGANQIPVDSLFINITNLNDQNKIQIKHTRGNIFDRDNVLFKKGYWLDKDGDEAVSSTMCYSIHYTPVEPNTFYKFYGVYETGGKGTISNVYFYKKDKSLCSMIRTDLAAGVNPEFTTPSDCAYIRFNLPTRKVSDPIGKVSTANFKIIPEQWEKTYEIISYVAETIDITKKVNAQTYTGENLFSIVNQDIEAELICTLRRNPNDLPNNFDEANIGELTSTNIKSDTLNLGEMAHTFGEHSYIEGSGKSSSSAKGGPITGVEIAFEVNPEDGEKQVKITFAEYAAIDTYSSIDGFLLYIDEETSNEEYLKSGYHFYQNYIIFDTSEGVCEYIFKIKDFIRAEAGQKDNVKQQKFSSTLGCTTNSVIFGHMAVADFGHVEGFYNTTYDFYTHAEGYKTIAYGHGSHTEGFHNVAAGKGSHVEGMGNMSMPDHMYAHIEGGNNRSSRSYQHVSGLYNNPNPDALFIVGSGADNNNRFNAFEILENGEVRVNGYAINNYETKESTDISIINAENLGAPLRELKGYYKKKRIAYSGDIDGIQPYLAELGYTTIEQYNELEIITPSAGSVGLTPYEFVDVYVYNKGWEMIDPDEALQTNTITLRHVKNGMYRRLDERRGIAERLDRETGEARAANAFGYTKEYIPVNPNTTYTLSGVKIASASAPRVDILYYDIFKTYTGNYQSFDEASEEFVSFTFTTPANCNFIRFNTRKYPTSMYLNEGTQANQTNAQFIDYKIHFETPIIVDTIDFSKKTAFDAVTRTEIPFSSIDKLNVNIKSGEEIVEETTVLENLDIRIGSGENHYYILENSRNTSSNPELDENLKEPAEYYNNTMVLEYKIESGDNNIKDISYSGSILTVNKNGKIKDISINDFGEAKLIAGSIQLGNGCVATGNYSHAEGHRTEATGDYSHAEGFVAKSIGTYSHAEGQGTEANKYCAHAEGDHSKADGNYCHAEGIETKAEGHASHTEGYRTITRAFYSHAEGFNTIASGDYQHVQGKYNIEDTKDQYAHIVGGGSEDNRANIHTLDWSGNAMFAGKITTQGIEKGHVTNIVEFDLGKYNTTINHLTLNVDAGTTWEDIVTDVKYNPLIDVTINGETKYMRLFSISENGRILGLNYWALDPEIDFDYCHGYYNLFAIMNEEDEPLKHLEQGPADFLYYINKTDPVDFQNVVRKYGITGD